MTWWNKSGVRSYNIGLLGVLFFAAFLPRLVAVGRYVTPDELIWVFRSVQFRQALLTGQWLDTLTAGHPGVITTWLGSLGISLQLWLRPSDLPAYQWITHLAWFAPENSPMFSQLNSFLTCGRLLVAAVNSAGVVLAFVLIRRLYGRFPASLIALWLALDPFMVGLSGLLHVDGLMTTFATLSLLALALTMTDHHGRLRRAMAWAALSGIMAGLAILSKSPALLLAPVAALFLFLSMFSNRQTPFKWRGGLVVAQGATWVMSCLLLIIALFPALWTSPFQVAEKMSSTSTRHLEEALRPSFFWGQTAYEHGPLFYPVTLSFRLSPVVLCGLILAFLLIIRALKQRNTPPWNTWAAWAFIAWPLLFLVSISLAAKKFDRYALPAVPALIIMASLGWTGLPVPRHRLKQGALALVAVQALFLAWAMPYPLTAVNPLLGGPNAARRVFDVGWGEAESAAARWLATQPDSANHTAVSWITPAVAPFFPGRTLPAVVESLPHANYVILPANGRDLPPKNATLLHTFHFNGLDRAVIYQQAAPDPLLQPKPFPASVSFSHDVWLSAAATAVHEETIEVILGWQLASPTYDRYTVKLTLRDLEGRLWAGLETPLLNDVYFYPAWWPAGETTQVRYRLPLPPGLPPHEYQVDIALFATATQAQLPLLAADGTFQGMAQALGSVHTPLRSPPPAATEFDPAIAVLADWLDGRLHLLTQADFPPPLVVTGDDLVLDLYWHTDGELPPGLQVEVTVGLVTVVQPLTHFDTAAWRPGEMIHEKMAIPIPGEMPGGVYPLHIRPLAAGGQPLAASIPAGQVEVKALARLFALPPGIPPSHADSFGGQMGLRGSDVPVTQWMPGDKAHLTLYWQVTEKPPTLLSAFVHLLAADGTMVAQSDQWPGGLPSSLWIPDQIIMDEHTLNLPPDVPPGIYRLAVGLYDPATGQRLPAFAANGRAHPDDQVILPLTMHIGE